MFGRIDKWLQDHTAFMRYVVTPIVVALIGAFAVIYSSDQVEDLMGSMEGIRGQMVTMNNNIRDLASVQSEGADQFAFVSGQLNAITGFLAPRALGTTPGGASSEQMSVDPATETRPGEPADIEPGTETELPDTPTDLNVDIPASPETRPRTFSAGDTNEHCRGPRDVAWRVNAEPGWEIDVNSIQASAPVVSSSSVYSGVTESSATHFVITGRLVNNGECIRAFGSTIARDGRGTLRVHAENTEVRTQ